MFLTSLKEDNIKHSIYFGLTEQDKEICIINTGLLGEINNLGVLVCYSLKGLEDFSKQVNTNIKYYIAVEDTFNTVKRIMPKINKFNPRDYSMKIIDKPNIDLSDYKIMSLYKNN